MKCGTVPAIWMWPFANCLHQHTSPLKSCLKLQMPFPSPGFISYHRFLAAGLWEHTLHTLSLLRFFSFTELVCLFTLGASDSQLWHLQNLIAWHRIYDIIVCCHGKCHQFGMMTSLPEGEDAWRGRHLFKHEYLCYLVKRQDTIQKTRDKAEIPIYMMLCFGDPLWWKSGAQLSPSLCMIQFQGHPFLTFGFIRNNIWVQKHLEFVKQNVPSNATSAFSCCHRAIILVERWASAILKRIAHLSTAFPMKPVYRQVKLASSSCTFTKTPAPISARNKSS